MKYFGKDDLFGEDCYTFTRDDISLDDVRCAIEALDKYLARCDFCITFAHPTTTELEVAAEKGEDLDLAYGAWKFGCMLCALLEEGEMGL